MASSPNKSAVKLRNQLGIKLGFVCITLLLSSCSFLERNTVGLLTSSEDGNKPPRFTREKDSDDLNSVAVDELQPSEVAGVEVLWSVSDEDIDGYILYYGDDSDKLTKEKRLPLDKLKKEQNTEHGTVFRYILTDVPEDESMFVSIAAYRGELVSEKSKTFEVGLLEE